MVGEPAEARPLVAVVSITGWRTSSFSYSEGNCVEAADWRTSSRSGGNGACVETGTCEHGIAVRDTKDRDGPVLTFTAAAWRRFTAQTAAPAGAICR